MSHALCALPKQACFDPTEMLSCHVLVSCRLCYSKYHTSTCSKQPANSTHILCTLLQAGFDPTEMRWKRTKGKKPQPVGATPTPNTTTDGAGEAEQNGGVQGASDGR